MKVVQRGVAAAIEEVLTERWQTIGLICCQVDIAPEAVRREQARRLIHQRKRDGSKKTGESRFSPSLEKMKRSIVTRVLRQMRNRSCGEWEVLHRRTKSGLEYRKRRACK